MSYIFKGIIAILSLNIVTNLVQINKPFVWLGKVHFNSWEGLLYRLIFIVASMVLIYEIVKRKMVGYYLGVIYFVYPVVIWLVGFIFLHTFPTTTFVQVSTVIVLLVSLMIANYFWTNKNYFKQLT